MAIHPPATSPAVLYSLDAEDRITGVGGAWSEFARSNGADELAGGALLGHLLWDFIAGVEVREIYRSLFEKARSGGTPLRVPFRCDSPGELRELRLQITPLPKRALALVSTTLRIEDRAAAAQILREMAHSDSGEGPLDMCSWCKGVHMEDQWWEIDEAVARFDLLRDGPLPRISHGICPICLAALEI